VVVESVLLYQRAPLPFLRNNLKHAAESLVFFLVQYSNHQLYKLLINKFIITPRISWRFQRFDEVQQENSKSNFTNK
jgi:hypothetical protein